MQHYYKLIDILRFIKDYNLSTEKNAFLKEENIRKEENIFPVNFNLRQEKEEFVGNFLIVSDTEKSKKYFLTLNTTYSIFSKMDSLPDNWKGDTWWWKIIPLIHLLAENNRNKSLCVWAEGYVRYGGYSIELGPGPGEIQIASIKQIAEIVEANLNPRSDPFIYDFIDFHFMSSPLTVENMIKYNKKSILEAMNIIE